MSAVSNTFTTSGFYSSFKNRFKVTDKFVSPFNGYSGEG